ncbi:glycerol-3-phosphate dehydrogenase, mitochondrial [Trichonephila clavipes]|nr:glycerol-3-phosphate dehydrogenase, mitochondrial [Trichonephila clavipes]
MAVSCQCATISVTLPDTTLIYTSELHVLSRSFEHQLGYSTVWLSSTYNLEEEHPGGDQRPPTSLPLPPTSQEDLRFDGYLKYLPCCKGTIHLPCLLQDSNPSPKAQKTFKKYDGNGIEKVCGAKVKDLLTGKEWKIHAKSVINATGPFTDSIRQMDDQKCSMICQPSAGVHIILPAYYRPQEIAGISSHCNTIWEDFNAHSTRWGYSNTSATGKAVEELLNNSFLVRIPSRPTFLFYSGHSSTPDLALTHANLSHRYSQLSDEYVTEDLINDNPEKSADLFVKRILCAAKNAFPGGQVKKHLPFWNEFLDFLKLKRAIIVSRKTTFRSFAANLDFRKDGPKTHKFVSNLNNEKSCQHWKPITVNGKLLTSPIEVVTALSKNYAAITHTVDFTAKNRKSIHDKGPATSPTEQGSLLLNKNFSYDELLLATNSMKKGKSARPDGVLPELIINLGSLALRTSVKHINITWETRVPHQCRKAEVISLLKKGKPANSLDSYRPISLISVCCKVSGKMVTC